MIGIKVKCCRYTDSNGGETAIAEIVSEPFVIGGDVYVYVTFPNDKRNFIRRKVDHLSRFEGVCR